jgi:hypothetical protein
VQTAGPVPNDGGGAAPRAVLGGVGSELDDGDDEQLVVLDEDRAVSLDPENDVCDENHSYAEVLERLAGLTSGEVELTDIVEDWHRQPGQVYVAFSLNGRPAELCLEQMDDWTDGSMIGQLNALLARRGGHFFVFDGGGQAFSITCLTPEGAALVSRQRPLRLFDVAPEAWPQSGWKEHRW